MQVHSVRIDIAKTVFHLVGLDEKGSRSGCPRATGSLSSPCHYVIVWEKRNGEWLHCRSVAHTIPSTCPTA